jgi:hypothetical protein
VVRLSEVYLTFVTHAADPNGTFHNRLGYERSWHDRPGTGDWWGRALWGLGAVVAGSGPPWQRRAALDGFTAGCRQRSPWMRAMAFAALGAAEVASVQPDHRGARALLADTVEAIGPLRDDAWPWPEARLGYANARVAEALIVAGHRLGRDRVVADGLALLGWLVRHQTADGHLSPVPAQGADPCAAGPAFDQQPIEVAALADAAAAALAVSGDGSWRDVVAMAVGWFEGDNDGGVAMHDPDTGGGYDGLTATGPNTNQGAESTIAWILTAQRMRTMAVPGLTTHGSPRG